jgi:dipeptidyl aminopeptidase/acylaminoacyl peptidase
MELSVLVYEDLQVITEDWELTVGESPMPKEGRAVPDHTSIWWNENIVVVVRSSVGALSSDALDAFLALGEASVRQLAYIGTDGAIWLVNDDGSGNAMFAKVCGDQDIGDPLTLVWSPRGGKLAVQCTSSDYDPEFPLVVLDDAGRPLAQVEDVASFRWSPDGRQLAYQTSAFIGAQSPQYEVRMLDLTTLEDTSVAEGAFLLEWAQPDRLLVGLNVENTELDLNYDAHWLDLGTGETEPVPRFDDSRQFWLSPDAKKMIVVEKEEGGPTLRIYDLETGEERPIPDSVIGFPSHGIPAGQIAFSPGGTQLYWADANPEPTVIYRANMDGSGLTRLGAVPSRFVTIAGDGKVAYLAAGVPGTIVVEDLEVGTRVEVGEGFVTMAWRPTP